MNVKLSSLNFTTALIRSSHRRHLVALIISAIGNHCSRQQATATTKTPPLCRYDFGPHTHKHTHTTHRARNGCLTTSAEVVVRSSRRRLVVRKITRRSLSLSEVAARMIVGKLPVASLYRLSLLETGRYGTGRTTDRQTDRRVACVHASNRSYTRPEHPVMSSPAIRLHSHNGRSTFPRPATSL